MRLQNLLPAVSLLAAFSELPTTLAWGAAGHEIVATIAQMHLHPSVLPRLCTLLNYTSNDPSQPQCHLAPIATWADRIRFRMRWSAGLHYIGALDDHPRSTCSYPGERGWAGKRGGNVLGGIGNTTSILKEWVEDAQAVGDYYDDKANEALKFLVHFLGDMHMPLHLTGRDRGGNSDKVLFSNRVTNLHSVWDSLLIAKALRTVPPKYSRPLPSRKIEYNLRGTIYDAYVRRIMWEGILGRWRDDVDDWLSCPVPQEDASLGLKLSERIFSAWSQFSGFNPVSAWRVLFHTPATEEGAAAEFDDAYLCPYSWSKPIHALNCAIVWPQALDEPPYNETHLNFMSDDADSHHHSHQLSPEAEADLVDDAGRFIAGQHPLDGSINNNPRRQYIELDTPEYAGVVEKEWIIEKLMAQAGIRLAGVLNWLFVEDEERERAGLRVAGF
ncbi:hypothetical protein HGRIS_000226 [Hohenbuehelia grisea]|uniref:Phospholipase C/P1 nuclease n=1 Tax=Hohenbuehelia grisea TaxID=104357 RepID=A0ABR3JQF2_9AGAR